jgi:hypothetical protein
VQGALHLLPQAKFEKVIPFLFRGAWTDEEDYELMDLFLKLGKKWSKMTKFIDGRN